MHRLKIVVAVLLSSALCPGSAVRAESANEAQGPACQKAEINPVTGYVYCIDPLGAAVEAPPDSIKPKCEAQSRGQWTWAPNCTPDPEGAQG